MNHKHSSIYDNGEEISQKVQKSMYRPKLLAAEEKATDQKHIKCQSRNQGKIDVVHVANQVKVVPEKPNTWIKSAEPTILFVKFPSKSALPSTSELKAKFVRFGPLDLSATRVSWKSSSCIVAFKCKSDALAAYDYAIHTKFLFGNANILYRLTTLEFPPLKSHKSGNQLVNQTCGKDLQSSTMMIVAPLKSGTEPKSCLKKPLAHVTGYSTGIPKQTLSVKFAVDEGGSSRREQLVVKSNVNFSNCNYPFVNRPPFLATLCTSKDQNLQQSILRPSPSVPDEVSNINGNDLYDKSVELCNDQSFEATTSVNTASTPRQSIDISQQMLSNLIRCSEIINNLKSALGYVPLHL